MNFTNRAAHRIIDGIRRVEQIPVNPRAHRPRGAIVGGSCRKRNEIWKLKVTGTPTGGSFDVDVTVDGTTDTLTFDYDFTAAEVKTELATHTNLTTSDISTSGGPFPSVEIIVEFIGDYAKTLMFASVSDTPIIDDSGLTGGTSPAAWLIPMQPGHPRNANP